MTGRSGITDELFGVLDALPRDADARKAFAALGDVGLFAPHFPVEYGGRGGSLSDYAAVADAIGDRGFADEVHLVTVQGVGCTVQHFGTAEQRHRWLPGIASGRTLASLMLSEVQAGSDAAAITTTARRTATGWILSGQKCWSLHADWSHIGLCSARTSKGANRYSGITLFLVDLSRPGVTITPLPRMLGEPYFVIDLDEVEVDDGAMIGSLDGGFRILTSAAGFERAGLDYLSRGRAWLRAAEEALATVPGLDNDRRRAGLARLDYELRGARELADVTLATADGLELDYVSSAYSKYTCGEAAQAVARWISEELLSVAGVYARADLTRRLQAAVAEGPELSISGNAVDLLLDTISLDPGIGEV